MAVVQQLSKRSYAGPWDKNGDQISCHSQLFYTDSIWIKFQNWGCKKILFEYDFGLRMRGATWNWFPTKNFADWFEFVVFVETKLPENRYVQAWIIVNDESTAHLADSLKACRKPWAFSCHSKRSVKTDCGLTSW